ncbi:hypothetical protein [uncultured Legionella sp.]|uniref:hypothetical protein n=1 Tax=uncultured Legionella sp. TaxID=210934 RepID=UPI00260851DC|nr:hypothetical protein [uncultured Legionella sp.]
MNQFKFLTQDCFVYQLKILELTAGLVQSDMTYLESKETLTLDEKKQLKWCEESWNLLIDTTFLQIYAKLEELLYHECEHQLIKKKASISRFETPLLELGYRLNNEHWVALINMSKIRNCLLHGNGRLDLDQYGQDTKETIHTINSDACTDLIEIIKFNPHHSDSYKIRLNYQFILYCLEKIKNFIDAQP